MWRKKEYGRMRLLESLLLRSFYKIVTLVHYVLFVYVLMMLLVHVTW
jgi:hypothetical protein